MDIKVLLQVLNRPWMMEPQAAQHWAGIAGRILAGENIPLGPAKDILYSTFYRVDQKGHLSPSGPVMVINIDGPILKYDYCGAPGTQSLTRALHEANNDETIQSIILYMDSPGGSVDGTEDFAKAVKNSNKPVVTFVNSMMASAAYWIGSASKEVISTGANNGHNAVIGSIGTMATWKDVTEQNEKAGIKIHEVYASASTDKNQDFKKANAGDYAALINNVLNPLNDTFLAAVKSNRAGKLALDQENVLSGKTYNAKDALKFGLIDRIGDFQTAVKQSLKLAKIQQTKNQNQPIMAKKIATLLALTLAASQAESFEALNEGIWLTEENLQNIENKLSADKDLLAQMKADAQKDRQQIQSLTDQVATLTQERDDLQAQVEQLSKEPSEPAATAKEKDDFPAPATREYAHNKWADEMLSGV